MKRSLVLLLFAVLYAAVLPAEEEWTYLGRDEKVKNFHLNAKGKLSYNGQEFEAFALQQGADRIAISPPSTDGKHFVVFSFGDENSQCSLLQLEKHTAVTIPLDLTAMVWNSWAPEGPWFVLGGYSEEETALYSVSITTQQARKISISLHKEGEKTELVTTTLVWTSPGTFELEAAIHCSTKLPQCTSREEERIIRSYKVMVNAESLEVQTQEQSPPQE